MEAIGQIVFIFLAGILVNISWTASFSVYALAFPIALLFALRVPEVKIEKSESGSVKEKMNSGIRACIVCDLTCNE